MSISAFRSLFAALTHLLPLHLPPRQRVTPQTFHDFSYSKQSHFQILSRHEDHKAECFKECDLKIYQDMLAYNFILSTFPKGARLLEIGGCDSRIIKWLKHRGEFWNLDKLEGVGNGLTTITDNSGFRLIRDYIGSFSKELKDGYFDGIFSISVLEHVPTDRETMEAIRKDIYRLLKPGGFCFHCVDVVIKIDFVKMHPFIDYLYSTENMINPRISNNEIRNDPDLWGMSKFAYYNFWASACKNMPYEIFGVPISYNLLWRKTR